MNPFTELVWDVVHDSPELLEQLSTMMKREYKPFLAGEQTFQVNAKMLEWYIREELDTWYEWLPDTPISRIGGGLAVEMFNVVDWDHVARLVQENILRTNITVLAVPNQKGMA